MLALSLGTGSPSFLSYFDFEIEAVLFVPALRPQLSNFSIVVEFVFYLFILYFLLSWLQPELLWWVSDE